MMTNYEEVAASIRRELALRERVYPRWVATKRMSKQQADHEIAMMRTALRIVLDASGDSGDLFPVAPRVA
jgi:hypothetical protein